MLKSAKTMKIEHKLSLYQVFLKLYEHNPRLLHEILQLENTSNQYPAHITTQYLTGAIEQETVYIITNLVNGETQKFHQAQAIWSIGRGRHCSLRIPDERLSRYHAIVEYRQNQGFYLIDLNSTNGTFLNQEPVIEPMLLQDGDRIRLGSIVFCFFLCRKTQQLAHLSSETLTQLYESNKASAQELERSTFDFFKDRQSAEDSTTPLSSPKLTPERQAEILERFFSREANRKKS